METNRITVLIDGKPYRLVSDEEPKTKTSTPEAAVLKPSPRVETPEVPRRLQQMMTRSAKAYPTQDDLLEACRDAVRRANGDKAIYQRTKELIAMYTPTGAGVASDVPPEKRQLLINDLSKL